MYLGIICLKVALCLQDDPWATSLLELGGCTGSPPRFINTWSSYKSSVLSACFLHTHITLQQRLGTRCCSCGLTSLRLQAMRCCKRGWPGARPRVDPWRQGALEKGMVTKQIFSCLVSLSHGTGQRHRTNECPSKAAVLWTIVRRMKLSLLQAGDDPCRRLQMRA